MSRIFSPTRVEELEQVLTDERQAHQATRLKLAHAENERATLADANRELVSELRRVAALPLSMLSDDPMLPESDVAKINAIVARNGITAPHPDSIRLDHVQKQMDWMKPLTVDFIRISYTNDVRASLDADIARTHGQRPA